ncbi:MAG TPA: VOC family protein [Bryobacteraceae bacterium]|jgi:Glyoxalase/Bleomycin resistance protein/Dioxygenase superfamily.|nr:VOC family protein [Bryobacteraceae bacterium]
MFTGIEHFAIASPDPKALAEWYIHTLEFRLSHEYQGNYFVRAQNGVLIEIIPAQGGRPDAGMKTPGMRHIAISISDFDGAYAELKAKGVEMAGEPLENQGNRLVFFKDLDGNLVHLIQRDRILP